ncbi:GYF domain containing protein [Plasmodiophora brassicae]
MSAAATREWNTVVAAPPPPASKSASGAVERPMLQLSSARRSSTTTPSSCRYTKSEMLAMYQPSERPPAGFDFPVPVVAADCLPPVNAAPPTDAEQDVFDSGSWFLPRSTSSSSTPAPLPHKRGSARLSAFARSRAASWRHDEQQQPQAQPGAPDDPPAPPVQRRATWQARQDHHHPRNTTPCRSDAALSWRRTSDVGEAQEETPKLPTEERTPTPPPPPPPSEPTTMTTTIRDSWWYQDPAGVVRGPFSPQDMKDWWYQRYFELTLPVRSDPSSAFVPLGALFLSGDPAFLDHVPMVVAAPQQPQPPPPAPLPFEDPNPPQAFHRTFQSAHSMFSQFPMPLPAARPAVDSWVLSGLQTALPTPSWSPFVHQQPAVQPGGAAELYREETAPPTSAPTSSSVESSPLRAASETPPEPAPEPVPVEAALPVITEAAVAEPAQPERAPEEQHPEPDAEPSGPEPDVETGAAERPAASPWVKPASSRMSLADIQREEEDARRRAEAAAASARHLQKQQQKQQQQQSSGPAWAAPGTLAPASMSLAEIQRQEEENLKVQVTSAPATSSSSSTAWSAKTARVPAFQEAPPSQWSTAPKAGAPLSMRQILDEEQRASVAARAQVRLASAPSGWSAAVAGQKVWSRPPATLLSARSAAPARRQPAPAPPVASDDSDDDAFWSSKVAAEPGEPRKASSPGAPPTRCNTFGGPQLSPAFQQWCRSQLEPICPNFDMALIDFLATLTSPDDLRDYLHEYVGRSRAVDEFASGFLAHRDFDVEDNSLVVRGGRAQRAGGDATAAAASANGVAEARDESKKKHRRRRKKKADALQ